ncbi:MAG: MBL fold metallo-hydrolase [Candidatus Abyssubacteria bacterium]
MKSFAVFIFAMMVLAFVGCAKMEFEKDIIETASGNLEITFIGHGTLMFTFDSKTVHVDPWSKLADYSELPKADIILVTHEHGDHFDPEAIALLRRGDTVVLAPETCARQVKGSTVMHNGDVKSVGEITVEAVPAYNLIHTRDNGTPYHPKGVGNGYVITFSESRVYVAGDTENTPEMKALENIDVAFLPLNIPYTMTPEMLVDAARAFTPKILYPYHYAGSNPSRVVELLAETPEIDVRIRSME